MIEGTKASLRLDGEGRIFIRQFAAQAEIEQQYHWRDQGFGGDCVYALNRHVADHFLKGAALENCAEQYLKNIRLEEAVYQSHLQGQRIELQPNLTIASFGDKNEF